MKLTNTYRKLVRNTTINDTTLLSTDYLNHYNELVMLLEMVPDMPDMLEEVAAWEPKTYQEHFHDSVFQHKDLAIWAYENAPEEFRHPMDEQIARIDAQIEKGLPRLADLAKQGESALLANEAVELTRELRRDLDRLSAIINGNTAAAAEVAAEAEEESAVTMGQSDIDALFD